MRPDRRLIDLRLVEQEPSLAIEQRAADTGMGIVLVGRWTDVLRQRRIVQSERGALANLQLTQEGIQKMERTLASVRRLPASLPDGV